MSKKPLTAFAKYLKEHKGSKKTLKQHAADYRNAELNIMPRLSSTCVGRTEETCTIEDNCTYVSSIKKSSYCKLIPAPRTAQQKESAKKAAAATRAARGKRFISPEEHARRSESAKRAAAATRAKRRAAGLPQRIQVSF
jgi:hypothetical protein